MCVCVYMCVCVCVCVLLLLLLLAFPIGKAKTVLDTTKWGSFCFVCLPSKQSLKSKPAPILPCLPLSSFLPFVSFFPPSHNSLSSPTTNLEKALGQVVLLVDGAELVHVSKGLRHALERGGGVAVAVVVHHELLLVRVLEEGGW